jgi:hypothetical protein
MGGDLQNIAKVGLFRRLLDRLNGRAKCLRGVHEPRRSKVTRKGVLYIGRCQRCGIPIAKRNGKPWRPHDT